VPNDSGGVTPYEVELHSLPVLTRMGDEGPAGPLELDEGAEGLWQKLLKLRTTASALYTTAHPDDEDTDLITVLVRGEGAVTAYLSLNRGEGGQNLIGPELGEALGLLRTEELLSARSLDGGRQYFTRAYDFGYSKTRTTSCTVARDTKERSRATSRPCVAS